MDTEKSRVLLHAIDSGNIRKTATELGYTPSGVSRMLASLERELGLTLLERSRKGVRPTRECAELLPYLKRLVQAANACTEQARAVLGLETGQVKVGIAYPQFYPVLTKALAGFRKLHPAIKIELREGNSTPLTEQLESGEIDFAIVSRREGDFAWHGLLEDTLVALVPREHPLANGSSYPLERFAEDPYVEIGPGEDTDNALAFRRHGIEPNTCYSVSLDSAGYEMVNAGLGVTLTNAIHAESHHGKGTAVTLPTEPELRVSIGVAYTRGDAASPAARAFADYSLPRFEMRERQMT